jgi:spermidine synthase
VTTENLEVVACEESPIGLICLWRRELPEEPGTIATDITLDHAMLMSSCNSASERALAASGLRWHDGRDLTVLVGGLGLGYTAREALRSDRVAAVEVVEFLPQVVGWLERDLLPLAGELKADARFAVSQGDVYARLAGEPQQRFDLILVDVDHSPDETLGKDNDAFYTEAGLARAKRHLSPHGVLGVWSYAECAPFAGALRRAFAELRIEQPTFRNRITGEQETHWLFFARG